MRHLRWLLAVCTAVVGATAQSCDNYGVSNGSTCACPPGFGGSTCTTPACGGDIFQGSSRNVATASGSGFANLTTSGCSCESGWAGTGCNVCQSANACQAAYGATAAGKATGANGVDGSDVGQNDTMVCSAVPTVYAASLMSCDVINPTLQSQFPLASNLNILRTLSPSLTPLPNVTGFGAAGSVYAQLFYDGVEQFACEATSCTQNVNASGVGSADWTCGSLACTCITDTTFCGGSFLNIKPVIDGLNGTLTIGCSALASNGTAACTFGQSILNSLFGQTGLALSGCIFGECVRQSVIDTADNTTSTASTGSGSSHLGGGVIAGLAVVGALIGLALLFLLWGWLLQRRARRGGTGSISQKRGGVGLEWTDVSYLIAGSGSSRWRRKRKDFSDDKVLLDSVSGSVSPGQMMAILGPSGAGKTTLVEILAGKHKSGRTSGTIAFPSDASRPDARIGFVPQQDILPAMLTVREALLFAARLRLPESVPEVEKRVWVDKVMEQLGISHIANARIGGVERRGVSGGEMRRVSIGLELVARPDILILDEPTSGLDSVSAARVAKVLRDVAHDPENPTAVIASIHQPSSQLYQTFDQVLLLAHGHALYTGPGSFAPSTYFASQGLACPEGYNVADFLLEVASDPPVALLQAQRSPQPDKGPAGTLAKAEAAPQGSSVTALSDEQTELAALEKGVRPRGNGNGKANGSGPTRVAKGYATTFLTQFQALSAREWKILRRDLSLFVAHVGVACVLGVFCGGLYYQTGITIAGFQSRVGCLFFLGALIAFSALSALYNVVESRPLFLRERSNRYFSPTAWLLSRLVFDVVPLRIIPTIIVSSITYWMAGLAHDAAHFFKFLFILVLYTLAMTLYNFLLACLFRNGGIAILLSALSALYQMTFAGFFVHLTSIPPVLRWLQWLCPLKYTLEALAVNEVGSGLQIQDSLEGVPVDVSASLIMKMLFGFGSNNYYRDVLVLFAFIAGFGLAVIGIVWRYVRERR